MKFITNIYISFFFTGYFKYWPGTLASIVSLIVLFPLINSNLISKISLILIFIIIFCFSIFFIKKYNSYTNTHDSGVIVIDEFLGIYLILIFYNKIFIINNFVTIVLIFLLFRFFDIFKIFPANIIDKKMKNSLGVLLDDIVAAIYTVTILYIINVTY